MTNNLSSDLETAAFTVEVRISDLPVRISPHKAAFALAGNGSQWPGAGKELFLASPTFQASIMESGRIMQAHGVDLTQCFRPNGQPSGKGDSVDLAAVGLTAIQVSPLRDSPRSNSDCNILCRL